MKNLKLIWLAYQNVMKLNGVFKATLLLFIGVMCSFLLVISMIGDKCYDLHEYLYRCRTKFIRYE